MANYTIKEISDRNIWEDFMTKQSPSVFMQSWNWGNFHRSLGRKVWNLGIFKDNELTGGCLCHVLPTKMRTHIYTSNGPVINWEEYADIMPLLLDYLSNLGRKNNALFVRMDPLVLDEPENNKIFQSLGMIKSSTHSQAQHKWILDITPDEEDLLSGMKKNTRYAIRRSAKEGIKVESSIDPSDFDKFWDLFMETVERQSFVPHEKDYYIKQMKAFAEDRQYRIYWSHLNGKVLATALIPFYGDTANYLHAASTNEIKNTFPAHALIWQIIRDAKAEGLSYFDFWGIAPTDDPKHPWSGFTFFKKSFGGFRQDVIKGYDLPLSAKYRIVRGLEKTRGLWARKYFNIKKKLAR
ncbi:peptidoglycan bridge formation glycyltransferase FemA/FemB family protein [Candidatus Dojkabacteria bacterium]|nr:peptidoglycan bridge formation glycyltransferase FemA/FemB family protein [Candidatus Dojkabacteria bacterium]